MVSDLVLPEVWKLSAVEQQPVQELVMDLKERNNTDQMPMKILHSLNKINN